MTHDDLSSWLKVVAENKITVKNTWKSTLIEHFRDIKLFKETQGINFQKASSTLDGCVKVYSTRVDDISEEALKLLDGFSIEEVKKKTSKRKTNTIEKNLVNLNIKTSSHPSFKDSKFTSLTKRTDSSLMLTRLDVSFDGVYRMSLCDTTRNIFICEDQIELYSCEDKYVCPNLNRLESVKEGFPMLEEEIVMEEQLFNNELPGDDNIMDIDDLAFDESMPDEMVEVQSKAPVYKETPFSYFKGWGGPSQWKIKNKKVAKQPTQKVKERLFLDFNEEIDTDRIFTPENTLFDQEEIRKRKEKIHNLPEDYNYEIDDLYNFNLIDRRFGNQVEVINNDVSMLVLDNPLPVEEPVDETFIDLQKNTNKDLVLPYKREQKKVDMKKLKENIFTVFKNTESIKLTSICKDIPKMYEEKEGKNISVHFCIVSLLHLAHENNLILEEMGKDIVVHK